MFLQGPHGPFMAQLAADLAARGATVTRIAFNAGDAASWRAPGGGRPGPLFRYKAAIGGFKSWLLVRIEADAVTDIVMYGDTRPFHAVARRIARARGLTVHCFEEGYLRPRWITYERGGVNGNSALMEVPLERMQAAALARGDPAGDLAAGPEGWGAAYAHVLHGLRYHGRARLAPFGWPRGAPHMPLSGWREARAYFRRVLTLPWIALRSRAALRQVLADGAPPYHLALLQLGADSSLRAHSAFCDVASVVQLIVDGFADGAARGDRLVFKAHPFEDGRERLARVALRAARRRGVSDRVWFVERGPLGPMLDRARSVVTVNSTAAQGALARFLPVRALGEAVYARPGLVSRQPLAEFFARPQPPLPRAAQAFRAFLLASSQLEGDFYTAPGRARAMAPVLAAMLRPQDPYQAALSGVAVAPLAAPPAAQAPVPVPIGARAGKKVARAIAALALMALVGACATPRAGPDRAELTAPMPAEAPSTERFLLVHVSAAVAAAAAPAPEEPFPQAFAAAPTVASETISVGERLRLRVWENVDTGLFASGPGPSATGFDVAVNEAGRIFVPYAGEVPAAGRTLSQLRASLVARLGGLTRDPQVEILRADPAPGAPPTGARSVRVVGEAAQGGVRAITGPTSRLVGMLAASLGPVQDPATVQITLRRGGQAGRAWLRDLYDDPALDVALQPGDTVIVDRDRRAFTGLGAVGGQRRVPFPAPEVTALEAVGLLGGLNAQAGDPTGVFVFRAEAADIAARVAGVAGIDAAWAGRGGAGPVRAAYLLDLTRPGGMFTAKAFQIRDGDVIYVTDAPSVRWMKVLGALAPAVNFVGSARGLAG
jgi:capsular polysaccharide export protein